MTAQGKATHKIEVGMIQVYPQKKSMITSFMNILPKLPAKHSKNILLLQYHTRLLSKI